jgi:apolipoprotein N-acyltransferase
MTCCVFERGITVVVAVEGSMTALILGEEGLIMVSAAAKTEGSILQKVSRKQKLTLEQ